MRVVALNPNPAIDLSGQVENMVLNEKNYVTSERRDPGGNGINAVRMAHRFGVNVVALGFVGGSTGDEFRRMLLDDGVLGNFTHIRGNTRINIAVTNKRDHAQTRLTFRGPVVSKAETARLKKSIQRIQGPGIFILGGSTPPGCSSLLHLEAAQIVSKKRFGIFVDVPAEFLKILLKSKHPEFLVLKPNLKELELFLKRKLNSISQIADAAQTLTKHATLVCVSLGHQGALIASQSNVWKVTPPKINALGSVGAGDSLVGTLAALFVKSGIYTPQDLILEMNLCSREKLKLSKRLQKTFRYAIAAGAASTQALGTGLATLSEIRRLEKRVKITQIK